MAPKRKTKRGNAVARSRYDDRVLASMPRPTAVQRAVAKPAARRGPPSKLASLPQNLFFHVLEFVLTDKHPTPEAPLDHARLELLTVALVSQAWRVHASELASQLLLGRTIVHVKKATRQELLTVRRKFTLRRPFLREMRLAVTPPSIYSNADNDAWLQRVTRFLSASFKDVPRLELLDLRNYCGASGDIAAVISSAARLCPQVQALLLPPDLAALDPRNLSGQKVNSPDLQPMVEALLHGMQQWHHHGSNGGLRQLRLPSRQGAKRFTNSVEFLQCIATHCPRIELFDAYALGVGSVCRDELIVDRATWTRFCSSCSQLQAFDWTIAPYATSFFQIFGKHVKPRLTGLVLAAARPWDWEKYYQDVGENETVAVRSAGVGALAKDVSHVLRACPALKTLRVNLHSPAMTDDGVLGRDAGSLLDGLHVDDDLPPLDALAAATKNSMNQELFGDDFIQELRAKCPKLEELVMAHDDAVSDIFARTSNPITTFTDRALRHLASLRYLSVVELKAVNVSGKGLFELINSSANVAVGQRDYELQIGDNAGPCEMGFYRALEGFLRCLQQHKEPLKFLSKKLVLRVVNGKVDDESKKWSETYYTRLKKAVKDARAKYPTLQFRIEVAGLTTKSFQRITAFGVFTASATPFSDYNWQRLPRGALVDGVMVKEEYVGDGAGYGEGYGGYDGYDDYDDYYDYDDYGGYGGGGIANGGYYGDYENERGHYGMGGYHFYNGLQLDDSYGGGMDYDY